MRRFVQWTMLLLLIITTIVGITWAFGQSQPLPQWIAALHLRDCALPCWINIVPGLTSGIDAFEFIDNYFLTTFEQSVAPTLGHGYGNGGVRLPIPDQNNLEGYVGLPFSVFNRTLTSIGFRFEAYLGLPNAFVPKLGEMLSLLGPPSCVALPVKGVVGWTFIYDGPNDVTEVRLNQGDSLDSTAPVYMLYMHPRDFLINENCQTLFRWAGLASGRYR